MTHAPKRGGGGDRAAGRPAHTNRADRGLAPDGGIPDGGIAATAEPLDVQSLLTNLAAVYGPGGTFDPVGNLAGNVPVGFPLHVASPHAAAAAAEEINPDAAHSDATEPQPLAPLTFLAGVQAAKRQQATNKVNKAKAELEFVRQNLSLAQLAAAGVGIDITIEPETTVAPPTTDGSIITATWLGPLPPDPDPPSPADTTVEVPVEVPNAGATDADRLDGVRGGAVDRASDSAVPAKTRVVRLLSKHVYEHSALQYIGATGAHGGGSSPRPGGAYPTEDECTELAATFRMWCRMPDAMHCNTWYLPTYELFLDCGRMLCDHMCLYGLGQLLSTGAGGDTTHRGPILDAFWKFDDAALIYNVLGSVTRVVRRHFIVQVYGLSGAQDRDALDAADLASWLQGGPHEPTTVLWVMFERTATALLKLFEANMVGSYESHCASVRKLLRVFIHAAQPDHPVMQCGMIDMLVPYTMYLAESDPVPENDPATDCALSGALGVFARRFWAFNIPSHGKLNEHAIYDAHFAGRSRIGLKQNDACDDSWLLASDQRYGELYQQRVDAMLKKMHALGRNPAPTVVRCTAAHFAAAVRSTNDMIVAQAVEAIAELETLRAGAGAACGSRIVIAAAVRADLEGVELKMLEQLLQHRLYTEWTRGNYQAQGRAITIVEKGSYRDTWNALRETVTEFSDRMSPPLQLAVLVGLHTFTTVQPGGPAACREVGSSVACLWFIAQCLGSPFPEISEDAAVLLSNVMATPIPPLMLAVMLPRVVKKLLGMLEWQQRGLRTTYGAVVLLLRVLEDYSGFDLPDLPELISLVSRAAGPLLLGELHSDIPDEPHQHTFGEVWQRGMAGKYHGGDHVGDQGLSTDAGRQKLLAVMLRLVLRDPGLLSTCFIREGGLQAVIDAIRRVRMDNPETARDCLELLDRLVTASTEIANAVVSMETAVMLLTVCANVGGDELQACARTVITQTLKKLDSDPLSNTKKSVGRSILKMALERDTATVIQTMMALPEGLDRNGVLKPEFVGDLFRESFEKAKLSIGDGGLLGHDVMPGGGLDLPSVDLQTSEADVTALLASPLAGVHGVEGVEGGLGVEEGFAEGVTPMVTCAGCGAPEVHTPHKILEVRRSNTGGGGIVAYCRPECQRGQKANAPKEIAPS